MDIKKKFDFDGITVKELREFLSILDDDIKVKIEYDCQHCIVSTIEVYEDEIVLY